MHKVERHGFVDDWFKCGFEGCVFESKKDVYVKRHRRKAHNIWGRVKKVKKEEVREEGMV